MTDTYTYKITFIGDSQVGKSSLLHNLLPESFSTSFRLSVGVDTHTLPISYGGKEAKVQLWEVGGIPRFDNLVPSFTKGTSVLFLVYDVTRPETLESVRSKWNKLVTKDKITRKVLIGTHADLKEKVSKKEGDRIAKELGCTHHLRTNAMRYDIDIENLLVTTLADVYYSSHPQEAPPKITSYRKPVLNILGLFSIVFLLTVIYNHFFPVFIEDNTYFLVMILGLVLLGFFTSFNYLESNFSRIRVPVPRRKLGVVFTQLKKIPRLTTKYYENFHHYERIPLEVIETRTGLNKLKSLVGIVGTIEITVLMAIAFRSSRIATNQVFEDFLSTVIIILFVVLILVVLALLILIATKRIIKETRNLIWGSFNAKVIFITIFAYFTVSGIALLRGWGTSQAVLLGLFLLIPMFLVNRLEGKFFIMFAIQQFFQTKNWDFLEGDGIHPIFTKSDRIKGLFLRGYSFLSLFLIPASFLGLMLNWLSILIQENPVSGSYILEDVLPFLSPELHFLLIFLIGLGPITVLLVKPMAFIENWANQSIYDKIASSWKISEEDFNRQSIELIHFPKLSFDFSLNIVLMSCMILINVGLASIARATYSFFPLLSQAVIIANVSASIAFLITLGHSISSLTEEKNMIYLARIGKEAHRDVINEYLWAEKMIFSRNRAIEKWLADTPEKWGVPLYLQGIRLLHEIQSQVESLSVKKIDILSLDSETDVDKLITDCKTYLDKVFSPSTRLLPELVP
ncbi:MAG: Rab family GTPase, partial [Candidatus Hodarchaeales archaeon]